MSKKNLAPTASLYTLLPFPGDGVVRTTTARILRAAVKTHSPEILRRKRLRIADVGCGTGEQTAGLARTFPQAEVVGIDINPRSLEKAAELRKREGLKISFLECDITADLSWALRRS